MCIDDVKIEPTVFDSNCVEDVKQELDIFLSSIFPDEVVREEFLRHYANVYLGSESQNKLLNVWCGKGNNGKSSLFELFANSYPEETIRLPNNILTDMSSTLEGVIESQLVHGTQPRLSCITELDQKINDECLERILEDRKYGTFLVMVNSLDSLEGVDHLNVFNFETTFSSSPNDGQLLSDVTLLEKIRSNKYTQELHMLLKNKLNN